MSPAKEPRTQPSAPRVPSAPHGGEAAPALAWPAFLHGQIGVPVRVILIDDDAHIRSVIARELATDPRIDLTGTAASLREGRQLIGTSEFDVMLVDLNLRDGSGFQLIEVMKRAHPAAEAIVVTVMEDDDAALRAFELGATGYLAKSSWFGNFAQAVLQVSNGGASITPVLMRRLLKRLGGTYLQPATPAASPSDEKLSEREREILLQVSAGYTSCEIGKRLAISDHTVNTHIRNIYRKLQVRTRAQAVTRAAERDLLPDAGRSPQGPPRAAR